MSEAKSPVMIQSLLAGFSIIDIVVKHGIPMKFNDIHNRTNITKSNLHKYLNTLISLGVLYRDPDNGLYSPGSTLIEYGMAAVNQEDIIRKVTPFLQEINLAAKETTLLAVWTHQAPMIIKMIHSHAGLNLGGQVGTFLPVNSAGGKLFASFLKGPFIEAWLNNESSGMSKEEYIRLEKEIASIQKEGIAFAKDALAPSVASVAIPVFDYGRELLGAVIIVGFEDSIPTRSDQKLSEYLLEKSIEISSQFGYSG
ncbi:IclR family transcriptional regulator [Bacillus sp. M6-12]|uniref:IclR family transcriptional regulator n=1 Tax=Bacillus sp. M6-12 TaxID=2054166 RepID=UPI000C77BB22|nr:IclR family transcriptional regulator [Bacillus sp. M6-12]PLS18619.1 IclR family transcriptional regulator [Bacillus sp. M6-12]